MKLFLIIFLSSICSLCSQTFYSIDFRFVVSIIWNSVKDKDKIMLEDINVRK